MAPDVANLIPFEPTNTSDQSTLATRIQQLVKQKGTFRAVTENDLVREVQDNVANDGVERDTEMEVDQDEPRETRQATLDRLYKARMEELHRLG